MNYQEDYHNPQGCARLIWSALIFVLVFIVLSAIVSCSSSQPLVKTEYRDRYHTDTVQRIDSVFQLRYIKEKGDTVFIHDSIDRFRWRDKIVKEYVHDRIDRPVPVPQPLNRLQKSAITSGYILWSLLIIACITFIIKLLRKFHII